YVFEIGVLQPVYIAASGKVIMAFMDQEEIELIFNVEEINQEERSKIRIELEGIREQGYAFTANERKLGALSIGTPIFSVTQKVIGSIICVVPVNSFEESQKDMMIK